MDTLYELTELFRSFPGIGPRQAQRFVYFLLERPEAAEKLAREASRLKARVARCMRCRRFTAEEQRVKGLCRICRDEARDARVLAVVARDTDIDALEKSGAHRGRYFVLGGTVPLADAAPQKKAAFAELKTRVEKGAREGLTEVVLALSANPEGEHTAEIASHLLAPFARTHSLKISVLGRGLSTGTELEYADAETLKSALKNRG